MAGGEPRLGTDSMYMGNHNSLLRSLQPIICQLHGYKTRTSEKPLDVKERRKLSLNVEAEEYPRTRVEPAYKPGRRVYRVGGPDWMVRRERAPCPVMRS